MKKRRLSSTLRISIFIDSFTGKSDTYRSNCCQNNVASWESPPNCVIKINVDAAFNNGDAAAMVVARDSFGNHLGSGVICFNTISSTVAEAKDYGLGIHLAKRLQFSKIIVEGDASDIPKSIKGSTNEIPWSIRSTILSIRDHIKDFSEISFTSVPRDVNSLAHDLAQSAVPNNVNRWWSYDEPPNCIMQHLTLFED
ncbi:uncharacterized protein LOC113326835 [Papaver somniferum]|uniref:uncharacterized protein LOC113326835 n=1 Tax=Papaver somniferum TaxID=3469 RepID=UPI000E6F8543|nr:uncharacterized protein LOC113326835 [Papaver somniferum]